MIFTLEALDAQFGDALLLHFREASDDSPPRLIVIDGGPRGVYNTSLRPRLQAIKARHYPAGPLPIDLLMVSHIDGDHITGILDLTDELIRVDDNGAEPPYTINTLWHNSFDDILGNHTDDLFAGMSAGVQAVSNDTPIPPQITLDEGNLAVIATVPQGRRLRDDAQRLSLLVNDGFQNLVIAPRDGRKDVPLGEGLTFTVVGPTQARLEELQVAWDTKIEEQRNRRPAGADAASAAQAEVAASVEAAAFADKSPFNLSSIVVLAEMGGRTMLLTGDARGDYILEGLEAAGLLDADGGIDLDILKVPHHGSDRNVTPEFFQRVRAKDYVISADGHHNNPDTATLKMLLQARQDAEINLWMTTYLQEVEDFLQRHQRFVPGLKWHYRSRGNIGPTIVLNLGDQAI